MLYSKPFSVICGIIHEHLLPNGHIVLSHHTACQISLFNQLWEYDFQQKHTECIPLSEASRASAEVVEAWACLAEGAIPPCRLSIPGKLNSQVLPLLLTSALLLGCFLHPEWASSQRQVYFPFYCLWTATVHKIALLSSKISTFSEVL